MNSTLLKPARQKDETVVQYKARRAEANWKLKRTSRGRGNIIIENLHEQWIRYKG